MEDDDWLQRGILVSNLPTSDDVTTDKLEIHFSKRSNGGGDVEDIIMLDHFTAMVKFKDAKIVESVLSRNPQYLLDSILNVTRYTKSVAEELKTSRNTSRPGSFHENGEYQYGNGYDESDGLESDDQPAAERCSCCDLFKIFDKVSASIPFENLQPGLPRKQQILNRISVNTGISWEVDESKKILVLSGSFDEVREAADRLQHYTNDESIHNVVECKAPSHLTLSSYRTELPDRSPLPSPSGSPLNRRKKIHKTELDSPEFNSMSSTQLKSRFSNHKSSKQGKQAVENRTSTNGRSCVERQSPTLKLRSSSTDSNPHARKSPSSLPQHSTPVPSESSKEESLDEYMNGDLETDGDGSVSEQPWPLSTHGTLTKDPEERQPSSAQKERPTAKIDVTCLDPKLLHYLISVKKTNIEDIQKRFSVKIITTERGQVTLEVNRDANMTSNSKNAIQDFRSLLDKIKEQDPEPEEFDLKDLNLTSNDLKRICRKAQNDNLEITVILDDDARIQIYGTSSAVEKARDWFSTHVFDVYQHQHNKNEVQREAKMQEIRHKVSDLSLTESTAIARKKNAMKVGTNNEDISDEADETTANYSFTSNEVTTLQKVAGTDITTPKKEQTTLVTSSFKAIAGTWGVASGTGKSSRLETDGSRTASADDSIPMQSSISKIGKHGIRDAALSDTKCDNQHSTTPSTLTSTKAKSLSRKMNPVPAVDHFDQETGTVSKPRQVIEEVFDQKTLDFIQSFHYNDLNKLQQKYGVEFEMKGNGRIQIRSKSTGYAADAELQNAGAALTSLVSKCINGKLVTRTLDVRDVPLKNVDKLVSEQAKQNNEAVIVTDGPGCKIQFFGAEKDVQKAVENFQKAIKSGKLDNRSNGSVKVVGKSEFKKIPKTVSSFSNGYPENDSGHMPEQKLIPRGIQGTETTCYTDKVDDFDSHKAQQSGREETKHQEDFRVPKSTLTTVEPWYATPGDNFGMNGIWRGNDVTAPADDILNDPRQYGDLIDGSCAGWPTSEILVCNDPDEVTNHANWYEGDLNSVVATSSLRPDFDSTRSQTNTESMEYTNGAYGGDFEESDDESPSGGLLNDIRMYGDLDSLPNAGNETAALKPLTLKTSAGFDVEIRKGDITLEFVSVIVCSADPYLGAHTTVARAIQDRAGPDLTAECRRWVELRGKVDASRPVYTSGGNLTCSQVLHVLPPKRSAAMASHGENPLIDMLQAVMKICARPLEAKSIAMPAIGIDSLQMKKREYAECLFDAVVHCILSPSQTREGVCPLETLSIVDQNTSLVESLQAYFTSKSSEPRYNRLFRPRPRDQSVPLQSHTTYQRNTFPATKPKHANRGNRSQRNKSRERNGYRQHSQNRRMSQDNDRKSASMAARFDKADKDDLRKTPLSSSSSSQQDNGDKCPVCLDTVSISSRTLNCKHTFCKKCLDQAAKHQGQTCPVCKEPFGKGKRARTMPPGKMDVRFDQTTSIPGYPDAQGSIIITYTFTSGVQGPLHPQPGRTYHGTSRTAYLPDNPEGRDVLNLLKRAFDSRLTFTIGTSSSTGQQDVIIWNDIHHKTNVTGGPTNHGYPDPTYLGRVRKELERKGIR